VTTLRLPRYLAAALGDLANNDIESAGVLQCAVATGPEGEIYLIGTAWNPVPDDVYQHRDGTSLAVPSDGWVPALGDAARDHRVAVWVHSHPGADADVKESDHDYLVDEQLRDIFARRTRTGYYAALVVGNSSTHPFRFTGHLDGPRGGDIDRVTILDDGLELLMSDTSPNPEIGEIHSRHVLAFGTEITSALSELRVLVIGAGGTGSATSEQLVRLGARHLTLIDDDSLSLSNTTRVYGSVPADVDRLKVEVLADYLRRIAPDADIRTVVGRITDEAIARHLVAADVIFGCTDDNAGRIRLSRSAYFNAAMTIDMAVRIDSTGGRILGIYGRVTVLHPGSPCLLCRDWIDQPRAAAEVRAAEEQAKRVREHYAPELGEIEPAVIAYTTSVAATAVGELLERLAGFGVGSRPSELMLHFHRRQLRASEAVVRVGCYCDTSDPERLVGDVHPFLDIVWSA
jgi:molybdopterin/thiamine biosynthesis adenylyltransferase